MTWAFFSDKPTTVAHCSSTVAPIGARNLTRDRRRCRSARRCSRNASLILLQLPLDSAPGKFSSGTFLVSSASVNNMQLEAEKFYNPCTSFVLLQVCKPRTQLSNSKFHTRTAWQPAQSAQLESAARSLGQQMQSQCVARALVFLIYMPQFIS